MSSTAFDEFEKQFSAQVAQNVLEEICDCICTGESTEHVSVSSCYQHNVINHTISGIYTHEGVEYGFVVDNGDWAGTVVREWGPADKVEEYVPEEPTVYTLVPKSRYLKIISPALWSAYLAWREESWFKDWERGYNYDRHFQPGIKTEDHYRTKYAGRGLEIADMRVFQERRDEVFDFTMEEIEALRKTWRKL